MDGQMTSGKDALLDVGAQPVIPPPPSLSPYSSGAPAEDTPLPVPASSDPKPPANGETMASNRQQG